MMKKEGESYFNMTEKEVLFLLAFIAVHFFDM